MGRIIAFAGLFLILQVTGPVAFSQNAIGYMKMQGNSGTLNLRVIDTQDAIDAGNGVMKVALPGGIVGAADLVPVSHTDANEVRISMPSGIMSWREERPWSIAYGGDTRDEAYGLTPVTGGGMAICGRTNSYGAGGDDFLFMKFDDEGDFLQGYAMGFEATNYGRSIIETSSGNFFMTGSAYNPSNYRYDVYIYHMAPSGSILLQGGLGTSSGDEYGEDCIETYDNNFVIIGKTDGLGAGGSDVYVKKILSSNGNNIWGWAIGTTSNDYGYSIIERPDSGFVAVGGTYGNYVDIYFLMLNPDGTTGLGLAIGGDGIEYGYDVARTPDNGYVIAGVTTSYGPSGYNGYIRKQDASGNAVWANTISGDGFDRFSALVVADNGDLLICGYTNSFGAGGHDLWLNRCDPGGNLEWSWVFGGANSEIGTDLFIGDDGNIYATGYIYFTSEDTDVLMVKFTADGSTCLGYALGLGGDFIDLAAGDPAFQATKIESLESIFVDLEQKELDLTITPIRGDLQEFAPVSRPETSITPVTTVICN